MKRALKLTLGWMLILLGIAGIVLPVLHGTVFLVGGLLVLSTEYVWAERLLTRLKARFPVVDKMIRSAEQKLRTWTSFRRTSPQAGAAD